MKKTKAFLLSLLLFSAYDKNLNASPDASKTDPKSSQVAVKIGLKNNQKNIPEKVVTYGEFQTILNSLMANLKGMNIPAEKKAAAEEMIFQYLISNAATLQVALASGIANTAAVVEKIKIATEKIIVDAYKEEKMSEEQNEMSKRKSDIDDMSNSVIKEKGDQVVLVALSNFPINDEQRIIKKMNSLKTIDQKNKEWAIISKNSGGKSKQLDPVLISEVPDILKDKLEKCKTGEVISIAIPDPSNPKNTQKTLFFVSKREKIEGELLMQALRAKMMDMIEKKIMAKVMEQVNVQKFDAQGKPTASSATVK